ncbi:DUF881 domain-containing protein [Calidifontibacter sp. DB0510]|uniref:DUF881 domain-containing protein n=1 Tax=Metallococcus carri TaxID=1656884 RepID=A0A967B271_9MICO|nr:DUF881 domain-containing protein [Metallococcus carri]NHN56173.1 DUF881 domain-containing protein [Metallococcus carri]NOP38776.1 DUF881 domain-containing protein [Calidifontibacter sp. DB2511S]
MTRRSRWAYAVPVAAAGAGLLFGVSAVTSRGTDLRPQAASLVGVVEQANARVAAQNGQVKTLQNEVNTLQRKATPGSIQLTTIGKQIDVMSPSTGFGPVKGDTLTISLDDSHRDPSTVPDDGNLNWLVVHQQDVQAVVNAMWRGGATAMMLMDQRVISTSAVRCVGNTLLLQGRVYSPPFTISAMGDPAKLRAALAADPDVRNYRAYVDLVGLGYTEKQDSGVTFPAYVGSSQFRYARPMGPSTSTGPEGSK